MALSSELISQFVKVTNDDTKNEKESTLYGTIVQHKGSNFVKLDGSELLTPISSIVDVKPNERVMVTIRNHSAMVTGNVSSPSARTGTVEEISGQVSNQNDAIMQINSSISQQQSDISQINTTIQEQSTSISTINSDLEIYNSSFRISSGVVTGIKGVNTEWISTEDLESDHAVISNLNSNYANINFSNIGKAAMEYFYANSGLIQNVVVDSGTITGQIVGVTISGDRIEGNTVIADKLVIKGEDGLYYKLNTDGITTETEQTDYNSLNGNVIKAKSITATKISVTDLVAFDATIGGFNITENSIYSGVKESIDNTTNGVYLDKDGQIYIGDSTNYLKYYMDENGNYKLEISADILSSTTKAKERENRQSKSLWSGAYYMLASQTINLSESISSQPNGIILVWKRYADGAAQNDNIVTHFIHKFVVSAYSGRGHNLSLGTSDFTKLGCKYLYISDDSITGNDNNSKTGTANGVTFANDYWVLTDVIGV